MQGSGRRLTPPKWAPLDSDKRRVAVRPLQGCQSICTSRRKRSSPLRHPPDPISVPTPLYRAIHEEFRTQSSDVRSSSTPGTALQALADNQRALSAQLSCWMQLRVVKDLGPG